MKEKLLKSIKIILKIIKITLVLLIVISMTKCTYNHIKAKHLTESRREMVSYFIENIDKYKEEFYKMGYEPNAYDKEYVHNSQIEMINRLENKVYLFENGLYRINYFEKDIGVFIEKADYDNDKTPLYYNDGKYGIRVSVVAPEYEGEYKYYPFNRYKPNFEDYLIIWDGEDKDDYRIKKYISAEELRKLLKEGKELEDKLMKLYEKRDK